MPIKSSGGIMRSVSEHCPWFNEREEVTPGERQVQGILRSIPYEAGMGLVNMFNMYLVVLDVDAASLDTEVPSWVGALSHLLLVIYMLELGAGFYAFRLRMYADPYSWLDTVLILTDILGYVTGDGLKQIACLRMLRLGKIGRVIHLLESVPELYLMLKGMVGAIKSILIGSVLAGITLLVWSILAVTLIHPINKEIMEHTPQVYDGCERCPRAYETVGQSLLTFSQHTIAGDSWGTLCVPIIERKPAAALFFFGVFATVVLASMNMMLAVIVDAASEARRKTVHAMAVEKEKEKEVASAHLKSLCTVIDDNRDGALTLDELQLAYDQVEEFRDVLEVLEVAREDMPVIFGMMDRDGSGEVSYEEFIKEMFKMQSSDMQSMLVYIRFYVTQIRKQLIDRMNAMQTMLEKQMQDEEAILVKKADEETEMLKKIEEDQQQVLAGQDGKCGNFGTGGGGVGEEQLQQEKEELLNAEEHQTDVILAKLEAMEAASLEAMRTLQADMAEIKGRSRSANMALPAVPLGQSQLLQLPHSEQDKANVPELFGQPEKQDKLREQNSNCWICTPQVNRRINRA